MRKGNCKAEAASQKLSLGVCYFSFLLSSAMNLDINPPENVTQLKRKEEKLSTSDTVVTSFELAMIVLFCIDLKHIEKKNKKIKRIAKQ